MAGDRRIEVRGVELAVSEDGRGRPLVWGHGLTSSRAHEDEIGILDLGLPHDRYRVIRYDARGHGRSEGTRESSDYHYDQLGVDQLALLDALGIDRAVLGGASMGSVTALHAAVAAPERAEALVLAIPPTAWEERQARGELYAAGADVIEQDGIEPFIELATAEPPPAIFAELGVDMAEATAQRYRTFDPTVLPSIMRGVGLSDLPDRDAVAALDLPVLLLAWDGDPVHPRATAETLHELIDGSHLHVARSLEDVLGWPAIARRFLDDLPRA